MPKGRSGSILAQAAAHSAIAGACWHVPVMGQRRVAVRVMRKSRHAASVLIRHQFDGRDVQRTLSWAGYSGIFAIVTALPATEAKKARPTAATQLRRQKARLDPGGSRSCRNQGLTPAAAGPLLDGNAFGKPLLNDSDYQELNWCRVFASVNLLRLVIKHHTRIELCFAFVRFSHLGTFDDVRK
jgi:hypothetical protein